jgi:hypothetical protein
MPEPVVREWRFYAKDMIAFAENVAAYTEGLDQKAFVASGLKKFEPGPFSPLFSSWPLFSSFLLLTPN